MHYKNDDQRKAVMASLGRLYSKGLRVVNATGIYEVVRITGWNVDNS